jgi:hypothetical protein
LKASAWRPRHDPDDLLRQHLDGIPAPREEAELLVSATRFAGYIAEQPQIP